MLKQLVIGVCLFVLASQGSAQQQVVFQDGVTVLPGGAFYDGTIDTEFRAANPTTAQGTNPSISIDDFDGGFQTQGAIRFENLLVSQGGLVPDGLTSDQILFAEFAIWKTSPTTPDANITFSRIVAPDQNRRPLGTPPAFWGEDDTWSSLGGDLTTNAAGLLEGPDPIAEDGSEAAAIPDFQDGFVDGLVANGRDSTYATNADGEDLIALFTGLGLPEADAIANSFFRYNVTEAVRDWLINGTPNFGWSINNNTGDGFDFLSSDVTGDVEQGDFLIRGETLRPALTIIFSTGPRGDLDGDGDLDLLDFQILLDRLAIELDGPIATGATGDLDFDRDVDLDDFGVFKAAFDSFNGAGAFARAVAVPEPGAAMLLLLVGLARAGARRG